LYSDKHGIFRVNSKEAVGGDGVTQFGRALLALNIDIICANSPAAPRRRHEGRGTDGLQTRGWRKADSNSRSHLTARCQNRDGSPL
jgi:hypothetical protein